MYAIIYLISNKLIKKAFLNTSILVRGTFKSRKKM